MLYKEYRPNILLSPYIETYWISGGFAGEGKYHTILPDGCVDIIFILDKAKNAFKAEIVGTMTTFLNISFTEHVQIFGIRFKPTGITAFTKVPVEEFTNKDIELTSVKTLFCKTFQKTLSEKKSVEEIIKYTDNYLINSLSYIYQPDKQIIRAVDLIYFAKGRLSLAEIASEACLCQRHFERKFKSIIGISPKTFAKIIRFKHTLRYLQNNPQNDLLSAAIECGYYDHTHLIKDFKILSGNTPNNIRR